MHGRKNTQLKRQAGGQNERHLEGQLVIAWQRKLGNRVIDDGTDRRSGGRIEKRTDRRMDTKKYRDADMLVIFLKTRSRWIATNNSLLYSFALAIFTTRSDVYLVNSFLSLFLHSFILSDYNRLPRLLLWGALNLGVKEQFTLENSQ